MYSFRPRGHKSPPTLCGRLNPTHTPASNAVAFQPPAMPNTRMWLCTQCYTLVFFPPRTVPTAPSRFPNMIEDAVICLGNCPPRIRMSASVHKRFLVRNVVSMLSHRVISKARLYEVIRWYGFLRCAPIMWSETRWCTVRSLELCLANGPRTRTTVRDLRVGGMHIVYFFFACTVKAKARQISTTTSIILANPCGDREAILASSAYSIPHTARGP